MVDRRSAGVGRNHAVVLLLPGMSWRIGSCLCAEMGLGHPCSVLPAANCPAHPERRRRARSDRSRGLLTNLPPRLRPQKSPAALCLQQRRHGSGHQRPLGCCSPLALPTGRLRVYSQLNPIWGKAFPRIQASTAQMARRHHAQPPSHNPPPPHHHPTPPPAPPSAQNALRDFAPGWVAWVDDPQQADVELMHVLGLGEPAKCAACCLAADRRLVVAARLPFRG